MYLRDKLSPGKKKPSLYSKRGFCLVLNYLFENFFNVLNAVFVAFLGRVAVYLLRTVESSGLLYAAGGNFVLHLSIINKAQLATGVDIIFNSS